MIRPPPRSTQSRSSAASDVYKRQGLGGVLRVGRLPIGRLRCPVRGERLLIGRAVRVVAGGHRAVVFAHGWCSIGSSPRTLRGGTASAARSGSTRGPGAPGAPGPSGGICRGLTPGSVLTASYGSHRPSLVRRRTGPTNPRSPMSRARRLVLLPLVATVVAIAVGILVGILVLHASVSADQV